ncbi:MAG: hypothetical protein EPN26_10175, partial [Rhodospirillales bacterium]
MLNATLELGRALTNSDEWNALMDDLVGNFFSSASSTSNGQFNLDGMSNFEQQITQFFNQGMLSLPAYNSFTQGHSNWLLSDQTLPYVPGFDNSYDFDLDFDALGAFYESTSVANDNSPSIADKTPVILDADHRGLTEANLRNLDSNNDSQLSGSELETLRAWADSNEDGMADAGEITALNAIGIRAIRSVDYGFYTRGNSRSSDSSFAANIPPTIQALPGMASNSEPPSNYQALWADAVDITNNGEVIARISRDQKTILGTVGDDSFDGYFQIQGANNNLIENFLGGPGNDDVGGSIRNDNIWGGIGNDSLYGYEGSDKIYGEENNDQIYGWEGQDSLFGGLGMDSLLGGASNDVLMGGDGGDQLQGYDGDDKLAGEADTDLLFGDNGNDLLLGGDGNDTSMGDDGDDTLAGEAGNDLLFGVTGNDTLLGGDGDDQAIGGNANDKLAGEAGEDRLFGQVGDDALWGGDGNDWLIGFNGSNFQQSLGAPDERDSDILYAGDGHDLVVGGPGDDTAYGENGVDELHGSMGNDLLYGEAGDDHLFGQIGNDIIYGGNGDDILIGFTGSNESQILPSGESDDDWLYGGAGSDYILGKLGNDYVDGGAGADEMEGGEGSDTYIVNSVNDSIRENKEAGDDTVISSTNYQLNQNIENLQLLEGLNIKNINGTGNALDNRITGNDFSNVLDGVTGKDEMIGADGNDIYYVDDTGDRVVELAGEGVDSVKSNIDAYILGSQVENLELLDFSKPEPGLVNDATVKVYGYPKRFELDYTQGDEVENYEGTCALTSIANLLTQVGQSTSEEEVIYVAIDNSWTVSDPEKPAYKLGGTTPANQLNILQNVYQLDIKLLSDYSPQGIANLIMSGRAVIVGVDAGKLWGDSAYVADKVNHAVTVTGVVYSDDADGRLMGFYIADSGRHIVSDMTRYVSLNQFKEATNVPNAYAIYTTKPLKLWDENMDGNGNDLNNVIVGNRGDNALSGQGGDDTLSGGDGADTLKGDAGADKLRGGLGDDAYWVDDNGDDVVERADEGSDTVRTDHNYALTANVENLLLTGIEDINGTGNALKNELVGNAGDNTLIGGGGRDSLSGGTGKDSLVGGAANDTLIGGPGQDMLWGGGGFDVFVFNQGDGVDTVKDNPLTADKPSGYTIQFGKGVNPDSVHLKPGSLLIEIGDGSDSIHFEGFDPDHPFDNPLIDHLEFDDGTAMSYGELLALGFDLDGTEEADTIQGTAVNDRINALGGNDVAYGKAGDDTLNGGGGVDTLYGGMGNDRYFVDNPSDVIAENADEGIDTVKVLDVYKLPDHVENLQLIFIYEEGKDLPTYWGDSGDGNALDNRMEGNDYANDLIGWGGNDTIDGWAGDDNIYGDEGDDSLYGGADAIRTDYSKVSGLAYRRLSWNDDTMEGGTGDDTLDGGSGNDEMYGNDDDDVIYGGDDGLSINVADSGLGEGETIYPFLGNDDWLSGGNGQDSVDGGSGDDDIYGGNGDDTLFGGQDGPRNPSNQDKLYGGAGQDRLDGGTDRDDLYGDDGNDLLQGGHGNDYLDAGTGNDTLDAGEHSDEAYGRDGDDVLFGGADSPIVVASYTGPMDAVYQRDDWLSGGNGQDSVDSVDGGSGDDDIYGGNGDDTLFGGQEGPRNPSNQDKLYGGTGQDRLDGGTDRDDLYGNDGNDTLQGGSDNDYLDGGTGDDVLDAGENSDDAYGRDGNDTLYGGADSPNVAATYTGPAEAVYLRDDWLSAGAGNDSVDGGSGDDDLFGGDGNDSLFGGLDGTLNPSNEDRLYGGAGQDTLDGGSGKDWLEGNAGDDSLEGGSGDDTLIGGAGSDTLRGGGGTDVYLYNLGDGVDTIVDTRETLSGEAGYVLKLGEGVNRSMIQLKLGSLLLEIGDGGDGIHIEDFDPAHPYDTPVLDHLEFADGSVVTYEELLDQGFDLGGSSNADTVTGTAVDDRIETGDGDDVAYGEDGDDTLDGGIGSDTLVGGMGNDVYRVDAAGDVVIEAPDAGIDRLESGLSQTLPAEVEHLTLTGVAALEGAGNERDNALTGNDGDNRLDGLAGHDTLDGGMGVDTLSGGVGDDVYVLDNPADVALENPGAGRDRLESFFSLTLSADFEDLTLRGEAAIDGTGTGFDNVLIG